jgi:uncharacterized membrane protein
MGTRRLIAGLTILGSAVAVLVCGSPAAASTLTPTPVTCSPPRFLPDLGFGSAATAENEHGAVVGFVKKADGSLHAAEWRDGVLQPLFDDGHQVSVALDVNDRGLVLWQGLAPTPDGWVSSGYRTIKLAAPPGTTIDQTRRLNERGDVAGYVDKPDGTPLAVRWDAPGYRPRILPLPDGDLASEARGINDARATVGSVLLPDGSTVLPAWWDGSGRPQLLPALAGPGEAWINDDAGEAAGFGFLSPDTNDPTNIADALFWTSRHQLRDLGHLPGTNYDQALGISQRGWVVGSGRQIDPNGQTVSQIGWIWPHHGSLIPIPTPVAQQSTAHDVTERGTVVGAVGPDADFQPRATIWECGPSEHG